MRIGSSTITMQSEHTYSSTAVTQYASITSKEGEQVEFDLEKDGKSLFEQMKAAEDELAAANYQKEKLSATEIYRPVYTGSGYKTISSLQELKCELLENLIESLRQRKALNSSKSFRDFYNGSNYSMMNVGQNRVSSSQVYVTQVVASSFYAEEETTAFTSEGKVTTADGRSISFNISFEMSRAFMETTEIYSEHKFQLCDPLVLNFDGDVAELSDQKFLFDIDADGEEEEISYLAKGNGFLALDKNGDGKINDGSELFGTGTGNGFKELEAYDEDGNGWIDEADSVFSRLKVWTKNANGEDELIALGKAGVGAIYLDRVATEFHLNNEEKATNGVIQNSGIFLKENGEAGFIQHVDFAV